MADDKPQSLKKSLYNVISMKDYKPDQRMIQEALGVEPPKHGGYSDRSARVPLRPRQPG